MSDLDALLVVQDHDLRLDQLAHRRAHLPEQAELDELLKRRAATATTRDDVAARRDEVAARQATAETEIAASEKRIGEIEDRMRSGAVTASRDLQAMQGEVDHLRERISSFEDEALAAMDEREPLDAEVEGFDVQLDGIDELAASLRGKIDDQAAGIDSEIASERAARATAAAGISAPLLEEYDRLRARLGGIGAARLDGNRCTGCHLALPSSELEQLRKQAPGTVAHCEQCGRIIVRIA